MYAVLVHENPDIYQVRVPFANVITTETNCYVVRDGDDALVVDSGAPAPGSAELLSAALRELGVEPARARYFLTHAHYDHAGLVPKLAGPKATVYVHEDELEALRPGYGERAAAHVCRRFQEEGVPWCVACGDNAQVSVSVTLDESQLSVVAVREGSEIIVGRHLFRVVSVPGHTHGHAALYHPASGVCFTGDHVLFVVSPSIPLYADGTDSLGAYFASLDKLAALNCSQLLISHGELRTDFAERIAHLKRHHLAREDVIVDIARAADAPAEGFTGREIIQRIPWKIPFATVDECESLQRWSIYSQGIVLLDHLVAHGRLERVPASVQVPAFASASADGAQEKAPAFVNRYLPATRDAL